MTVFDSSFSSTFRIFTGILSFDLENRPQFMEHLGSYTMALGR